MASWGMRSGNRALSRQPFTSVKFLFCDRRPRAGRAARATPRTPSRKTQNQLTKQTNKTKSQFSSNRLFCVCRGGVSMRLCGHVVQRPEVNASVLLGHSPPCWLRQHLPLTLELTGWPVSSRHPLTYLCLPCVLEYVHRSQGDQLRFSNLYSKHSTNRVVSPAPRSVFQWTSTTLQVEHPLSEHG